MGQHGRETAEAAPGDGAWLEALAEHAREDRVVGVAELPMRPEMRRLWIVTTWHGFDVVCRDLTRIGGLVLGAPAAVVSDTGHGCWEGLAADLRRASLEVVRIGDLTPDGEGRSATVLLDRHGLLEQWVRWSRGRPNEDEGEGTGPAGWDTSYAFQVDDASRVFAHLEPGDVTGSDEDPVPVRPVLVRGLRESRDRLHPSAPLSAELAARIGDLLRTAPLDGAGLRTVPQRSSFEDPYDAFLSVADGEGFRGDRALFDAAAEKLRALARRSPEFDEGFLVPTFDAVEVRWRFGEGVRGRRWPLVPCVHVGVGVTPGDDLEFWAAAAVREPTCTVACVADDGRRTVLPRTAGRDALVGALTGATESAWRGLRRLLRATGRARRLVVADADAELRPLHLPRSFRESACALLRNDVRTTRADVAMALARSGDDADPLVARKLGLAAGRLLAQTP